MSYNIDTWTTKELRDLRIPLTAFDDVDYMEEDHNRKTGEYTFSGLSEGFELRGREADDGMLAVESITSYGEGSGRTLDDLEEIFKVSTGYLRAILIWEGGDSIERLIVQDGTVTREDIELD